jgi:hypothetical protein
MHTNRMGMVESCNSANFNHVDGILGFGWSGKNRSAALLKTLSQDARYVSCALGAMVSKKDIVLRIGTASCTDDFSTLRN